ncbi:hypothetical protein KR009_004853 [Drosophila setifemur]|nr:hypothetical protein KR009_004853 [Drosophila setifemur]
MLNEGHEADDQPLGSPEVRELFCSLEGCPYRTNRAYNLWRHEERHTLPMEKKLFACPFCIYSTDKTSNLKRHINVRHPSCVEDPAGADEEQETQPVADRSNKIHCLVMGCKYETNRPYDMKRHMMVHNNPEKSHRSYKCSLCMYSSDRKANLKRHLELRHSGIEVLCDEELDGRIEETVMHEEILLQPKVNITPTSRKAGDHPLNSLIQELQDDATVDEEPDDREELKVDYIYGEEAPLITISSCKSQILQADISDKQVIAVNVNGQLRWFQSIDPPPGAPTKLQLALEEQEQQAASAQQQMDELDDELALSLAEQDQQEILEMLTKEEETIKEHPTQKELTWSWSTPHATHHVPSANSEALSTGSQDLKDTKEERNGEENADFPVWWDDGEYTKMHRNQTYRDQRRKPSQANVQRILRIIYDIYYKPFKEDRKHSEVFQIKDSWLCATRMTRMQIIKDMYSKQGT